MSSPTTSRRLPRAAIRAAALLAALAIGLAAPAGARAAEEARTASLDARPGLSLGVGVRAGLTLDLDEAVAGAHVVLAAPRVGPARFSVEPSVLFGFGDDYFTFRAGAHMRMAMSLGHTGFSLSSIAGAALFAYAPIAELADFCDRLDVACAGVRGGVELGGGIAWRAAGLDVVIGFFDLPTLTIVGTVTHDVL